MKRFMPQSAHEQRSQASQWPDQETLVIGGSQAANYPITVGREGNFFILKSATGTVTAAIIGSSSKINVQIGRFYYFDDPFGSPAALQFFSTSLNDVLTVDIGYGFQIPFDAMPGGSGNPAQVAASTDEFLNPTSVANAGGTLTLTPKFACPGFWVHINGGGILTSGSVKITANTYDSVIVPCIGYDQFGNQVTDENGVIQFGQINTLVSENSSQASIFIDGAGIASVTLTNNLNAATNMSIGGTHFPFTLMIGTEKVQPTYRLNTGNLQAAAVPRFFNLTPPTGGTPSGGYLYLERILLSISATASSAGRSIRLLRCNTLDTGGTSTSFSGFGNDPLRASLGTGKLYTVAQGALGTINDVIDDQWLTVPANASLTSPNVVFDFRQNKEKPKIPFFNGSTWQFALDIDAAQAGQVAIVTAEFKIY